MLRGPLPVAFLWTLCACHPERWTDRPAVPRDVDALTYVYREHSSPLGAPGEFTAYTITVGAVGSDVVFTSALPERDAYARDDGRPPDRDSADNVYTGVYRTVLHRSDPQWFFKTRPPPVGDLQRSLPVEQERVHPFALRRFVAGGAGGAGDNASVCPPGYVVTGLRHRLDAATRTVAQVAPTCRAFPRPGQREPGNLVEAAGWGEEIKAPLLTAECPQGSAVVADARLWLRAWRGVPVVAALELRCALVRDATRRTVATLAIGEPGEDDGQRFSCAETDKVRPAPLAAGLRVISGMRLDALGFLCDVGRADRALAVDALQFEPRPSVTLEVGVPLAPADGGSLFVRAALDRCGVLVGRLFSLPPADALLTLEAQSAAAVDIVAPLDGCQLAAAPGRVLLAASDCATAPQAPALLELSGGSFAQGAPGSVKKGSVLGRLPAAAALQLRLSSPGLLGRIEAGQSLPPSAFSPPQAASQRWLWEVSAVVTPARDPILFPPEPAPLTFPYGQGARRQHPRRAGKEAGWKGRGVRKLATGARMEAGWRRDVSVHQPPVVGVLPGRPRSRAAGGVPALRAQSGAEHPPGRQAVEGARVVPVPRPQ